MENDPHPLIRIGTLIRLKHKETGSLLRSFGGRYRHPGSTRQQMVVAGPEHDDLSLWIVQGPHGQNPRANQKVVSGSKIRLFHVATRTNLHSHENSPAPINRDQQEVTAFGKDGVGDENDDWIVECPGEWRAGSEIRFRHARTNHLLHSHDASDPILTGGYQEVTAFRSGDANDFWVASAVARRTVEEGRGDVIETVVSSANPLNKLTPEKLLGSTNRVTTYVLDYSVLAYDPHALFRYEENNVVVPVEALEELDRLTREGTPGEMRNAVRISRVINELVPDTRSAHEGVRLPNGGTFALVINGYLAEEHQNSPTMQRLRTVLPDWKSRENLSIASALFVQETSPPVTILVTRNVNQRLKARAVGLESQDHQFAPEVELPDEKNPRPAGYSTEHCGLGSTDPVPDSLGVGAYSRRLAELILARETKLPLAVGLFGDWGSGKSHFMNLMEAHMRYLSAETAPSPWHRQIVSVHFNAWHYLDTNLWASLVTEIFDRLFRHVGGEAAAPEEQARRMNALMAELQKANGAVSEAEASRQQASEEKVRAEGEEKAARDKAEAAARLRETLEGAIAGTLDNLKELVTEGDMQAPWKDALRVLRIEEARNSFGALTAQLADLRQLHGRARATLDAILDPKGRKQRIGYLIGAVILAPLLGGVLAWGLLYFSEELRRVGAVVGQCSGLLAGLAGWFTVQIQRGRTAIEQVEAFAAKANEKREAKKSDPELLKKQAAVQEWTKKEAEARQEVKEAHAKVRRLEEELREWAPDRRLFRFIEQRAKATDYRSHLGLVSLVRRDFHELSRLFAENSDRPASTDGLGRPVDRIVLYIDDLDRCQPEKVVDVLQAVHLLLAFPLFAVVVGVDQRCLKRSLEKQFVGLVSPEKEAKDPGSASALDYLEKVFHIPFHLPPMDKEGFSKLVDRLGQPEPEVEPSAGSPVAVTEPNPSMGKIVDSDSEIDDATSTGRTGPAASLPPSVPPPLGSVPLQSWELSALSACFPIVTTPRATVRLLNTYRLVRAGVDPHNWDRFAGKDKAKGEYRLAILLLACAAGQPARARIWFDQIFYPTDEKPVLAFLTDQSDSDLAAQLQDLRGYLIEKDDDYSAVVVADWINRVERYTF